MSAEIQENRHEQQMPTWTATTTNPFGVLTFYNNLAGILEEKKLLESLKSENFDVGICELFDFTGIPVFEAIGLKNIVGAHTTSCLMEGTAYAIGAPVIPSYMPARAAEIAMVEKLGDSATPIWDTVSNMSWILTNTEPLLEFAKPTLHKVIDIGGIGVAKPKPLDEKWHKILSLREHTILISFGSVAASIYMPYEMKVAIVDVVKSYPDVTFIWKYEEPGDSFAAGVENLFLSKWTPQVDLLADDRLTLFITHGGAGSMMESATGGKPLIVVPLFGDQTRNAKLIAKFGFGIMLHKSSLLDRSALRDAIGRALKDERYRKAAHRIRDLLARRPFTPEQKLVKTIEMAAEFGEIEELRVAGRKLGFIVYYNIDLILTFFIFVVLLVWIVLYNVKRICILRSLKPKVKEQ
ncbi:hypothetical protein ANCCEY_03964 [Ancylostoma ceylanicum]|uniref:UDP-glucuronosyltransferase n=1 Tax=Ancylostoma ceylanicum TaxID=53326 RepID=A0A0D6M0D7_9BILA|nr:hypothetical protein ANCCEY_03964 [Ancylostoma ceylanicum]